MVRNIGSDPKRKNEPARPPELHIIMRDERLWTPLVSFRKTRQICEKVAYE